MTAQTSKSPVATAEHAEQLGRVQQLTGSEVDAESLGGLLPRLVGLALLGSGRQNSDYDENDDYDDEGVHGYQRNRDAAQVKPLPKAAAATSMPFSSFPSFTAS